MIKSTPIKTLIIDDEAPARKRLRDLLRGREDFEIVGECSSGKDAVRTIVSVRPDLIFLDIQLSDMSGFEVLERLDSGEAPAVIFVTAYDKYALKAFEVHSLDYLLKPFDDDRFNEMLEFAKRRVRRDQIEHLRAALAGLLSEYQDIEPVNRNTPARETAYQERLVITSTGSISFIETADIDWIEAEGSYIRLNYAGKRHLMRGSLKELKPKLDPKIFIRIHRSTIVNITRVKELKPLFHGEFEVVLRTGKTLKLSRTYRENARRLIGG